MSMRIAGRLAADVMEMTAPQRMTELAARFQQGTRQSPEWFLEHAKAGRPGEPMPYDPRLGLSKAENDEFLALTKRVTARKKHDDTPLGAWNGVQWEFEESDSNRTAGTIVKLALGRLKRSGRGGLYYDVKSIRRDGNTRVSHVLNHDLRPDRWPRNGRALPALAGLHPRGVA